MLLELWLFRGSRQVAGYLTRPIIRPDDPRRQCPSQCWCAKRWKSCWNVHFEAFRYVSAGADDQFTEQAPSEQ